MDKNKILFFWIILILSNSILYSQKSTEDDCRKVLNKAISFDKASENDSALLYYLKALAIEEIIYGQKDTRIAMLYGVIGNLYSTMGNYDLALEFYQKALNLNIQLFGEKHQSTENSYVGIGFVYSSKNDFNLALVNFQKALNINLELSGQENPSSASYYNKIALCYFILRDYDSALENQLKCVKINQNNDNANPLDIANSLKSIGDIYYSKGESKKAFEYFTNSANIKYDKLGFNHPSVAELYNNMGECLIEMNRITNALEYFQYAEKILKENFQENSVEFIDIYENIGECYSKIGNIKLSTENLQKATLIVEKYYGEKHTKTGLLYRHWGKFYIDNGDNTSALKMLLKSLSIYNACLEKYPLDLASLYKELGNIYYNTCEYDFALEYYQQATFIDLKYLDENSVPLAINYLNIGNCFRAKSEHKLALEYLDKALDISLKFAEENLKLFTTILHNIGNVFIDIDMYDVALKYYQDAVNLDKVVFGENSDLIANTYNNIGYVHYLMGNYNASFSYYKKAVEIHGIVSGKKNSDLARTYNNIGWLNYSQGNNREALKYFQLGLISNLPDFNDKKSSSNPKIKNYISSLVLEVSLLGKARVLKNQNNHSVSLTNYQLLDTLIGQMLRHPAKKSDKFSLVGTIAEIYQEAISLCLEIKQNPLSDILREDILEKAFYFSERNKAGVLLEALAGQESLKFSGIPDSLLQKEHNLKVNLSFNEKKLAESTDTISKIKYQNQLFKLNRQYEELIARFEKEYPDYFNLKYAIKNPSVIDIQSILNDKIAIRSYFQGDSIIYIFTLTKNDLDIQEVPKLVNLNDSITWFRYGLTNTSPKMQEYYRRLGFLLYQQLFPDSLELDERIENLVIIPDGNLATLPFESLLTENYKGQISEYKEYPYLINKYNISYSYSANLFYQTFSKEVSSTIEIKGLNDWLALAPVFDNSRDQNMILSTRELQKQLNWLKTDSLMINRSMFDRSYITPLPATEAETETIFKLYDENNLKAKVLLHNNANEGSIKSGELEQYKVLHFATHGFVNSERPELSGLLLAQDSTGGEDGVLYSGEIYTLKLNADLVVLSACETGLGKIQKGEGIIGLTRALLYAGAKNIIVSLWQVADESTSELMIDFYKNTLLGKGQLSYSEALGNAKLKMINEGKYAHPLFWSPFILIGK